MLEIRIDQKTYGLTGGSRHSVLKDIRLSLPINSFNCLTGPSGCGKSTLLRLVLGLDRDFDGRISLTAQSARVAAVFQEPQLLPWRTVRQNVELAIAASNTQISGSSLDAMFHTLGIAEHLDFHPTRLSLGQARRVALARAFATQPDVLILDEPFVSLDQQTATRLRTLLMDLWQARPMTTLMVTHDLHEAVALSDHVHVMSDRPSTIVRSVSIEQPRSDRSQVLLDELAASVADARFDTE